ncbi:MAG: hypothetical protein K5681_06580 [Treponema sp.]|nr:hypothetical protein [Treponema sp.]
MKKFIGILAATFLTFSLFADYNRLGVPDSAEIRSEIKEKWFMDSLNSIRSYSPEKRTNNNGVNYQVRMEENDTTFNVFVAPFAEINVTVVSDKGSHIEKQEVYPGDGMGSWLLVRDKKTGKPLRIRYYFLKNSEVFVQFTPSGNINKIALADMVIFGNYAARGVPTGVPFEKFYTASLDDVMKITEDKLPWNYILADYNGYHANKQMIAVLREKLPNIVNVQDAMYDEEGKLVHISTGKPFSSSQIIEGKTMLSSAGFVKWIADGIVVPIAGGMLRRAPLLTETVEVKDTGLQGVLSQKYALFFSLNWIRNLASAVISVYTGSTYLFNQSGVDVTFNPFASSITDKGVSNIVTFVENSGYSVPVLKSLLYVLASTAPETFYFGAIRGSDRSVSPEIMAFNDCAAFFPYFENDGGFACSVFINGREMSLDDFCMMYSEDFVYLTRVKSTDRFFPE